MIGPIEAVRIPFNASIPTLSTQCRTVDELALTRIWPDDYTDRTYDYEIDVRTPVVVGVGLHFGAFDADLAINDSALYDPNAGSARRDVGEDDTFTSLTLRYAF